MLNIIVVIMKVDFGEFMTLFSDESTISEEVPINFENKVAIYDDYCDDLYAIKNNDNHEICHHDFSFQLDYASHDNYFVEFAPTTIPNEKNFAYVESSKFSMLVDHEKNALGAGYCNAPDTTFHIRNSNSCLFRRCDMLFSSVVGFLFFLFCILFMSCSSSSHHSHCIGTPLPSCFKLVVVRSCRVSPLPLLTDPSLTGFSIPSCLAI